MATEEGTEERDEDEDAVDKDAALALDFECVIGAEGVVGLVGTGPITCCTNKSGGYVAAGEHKQKGV